MFQRLPLPSHRRRAVPAGFLLSGGSGGVTRAKGTPWTFRGAETAMRTLTRLINRMLHLEHRLTFRGSHESQFLNWRRPTWYGWRAP